MKTTPKPRSCASWPAAALATCPKSWWGGGERSAGIPTQLKIPSPHPKYGSDVHFLMELVQNADDCSYAKGVQPQMEIRLSESDIAVTTNEVG